MADIDTSTYPDVSAFYRTPDTVMRLARMGSAHPSRLSFLRTLLRRIQSEGWQFTRPVWDIDDTGVGRAVYQMRGPHRTYSLVAFAHDLPDEMRSDRVIATAWDATFTLFDGIPTTQDLDRLQQNVPYQEAGRVSQNELCLSRANRSVRLFSHVVDRLAEGQQPDLSEIDSVGYLMRTTAVYGSGKFGAADRTQIEQRDELNAPFQAEMLSVWLIRAFTVDIVEHLAKVKGGESAVPLDPMIKRRLGVGNSTGLGMAPFLVKHPMLLNNWIMAKEEALARVRAQPSASEESIQAFRKALDAAIENAQAWQSQHPIQVTKLSDLRQDLSTICTHLETFDWASPSPWDRLWNWSQSLSLEGQEAIISLLLEPFSDLVDGLTDCMSADEHKGFRIDGSKSIGSQIDLLKTRYHWALDLDFDNPETNARFWYVSEEKLEPRLGERHEEDGAELEQPLGTSIMARRYFDDLCQENTTTTLAEFLLKHPEHRLMARRVQLVEKYPYSEVRDNLIGHEMLPIDLLRCKLAFFGATHFDPRSDKWVRISLFQGQPFPNEIHQ